MKGIRILIVIVIILVLAVGIKIINTNRYEKNKITSMSEQEIIDLIEKGLSYNNIYYKATSNIDYGEGVIEKITAEVFKKDDIVVVDMKSNFGYKEYVRKDNFIEETIMIDLNENTVSVSKANSSGILIQNGYPYIIGSYLDTDTYKLEFNRAEKINGKETVIITISDRSTRLVSTGEYVIYDKVAIDLKTGLIVKSLKYGTEYEYSFGKVEYKDIEKPDLTKYEVIDASKM